MNTEMEFHENSFLLILFIHKSNANSIYALDPNPSALLSCVFLLSEN